MLGHHKKRLLFKLLFLLQAGFFLSACTQMPQLHTAASSDTEYDSSNSQGISIEELLANARNNTVANPQMGNFDQAPKQAKQSQQQALPANEKFALALEREKMKTLLNQAQQEEETEALIKQYQASTNEAPTIQSSDINRIQALDPQTQEGTTISITEPVKKHSLWSPYANRDKGLSLYHRQRKAKEEELKSFLITLNFQTNSADIDANLEEELDHFSRLHTREQLVINCAVSNDKDTQLAYETAMIRCLSIETFFKQRNHITMSQVLTDIKPNQVLIFSDGKGF